MRDEDTKVVTTLALIMVLALSFSLCASSEASSLLTDRDKWANNGHMRAARANQMVCAHAKPQPAAAAAAAVVATTTVDYRRRRWRQTKPPTRKARAHIDVVVVVACCCSRCLIWSNWPHDNNCHSAFVFAHLHRSIFGQLLPLLLLLLFQVNNREASLRQTR